MLPIAGEIADEEVSQYKSTHYKMQFAGIKSYYCFTSEGCELEGREKGIIYNHGLSNNVHGQEISWKAKPLIRKKILSKTQ